MSTRSFIAMKTETGFTAVYCHWNGKPKWNGVTLRDHYQDPAKISQLLALGYISILGEEIGEKHVFERGADLEANAGWSTFYNRDRGDDWTYTQPQTYATFEQLQQAAADHTADWLYVYNSGLWQCCKVNQNWGAVPGDLMPIDYYLESSPRPGETYTLRDGRRVIVGTVEWEAGQVTAEWVRPIGKDGAPGFYPIELTLADFDQAVKAE